MSGPVKLTELPWEILQQIMLFTMDAAERESPRVTVGAKRGYSSAETFLNTSTSDGLRHGMRLAATCRRLYVVFHDSLTGVKLASSWQEGQDTLIAACKIAARNLRAVHLECSAPVTAALQHIVTLRPPVRYLVLIGVNISKSLMADIVASVGSFLTKLVISAAPSLNDVVIDLIAEQCRYLKYLELGGSRHVGARSLIRVFEKNGGSLRGLELNALQHESLNENVLVAMADFCIKLTTLRLLTLRWVTDCGLERFFKSRATQLTEFGISSCRKASAHALCALSAYGASLENLRFSFDSCHHNFAHESSSLCSYRWRVDENNPCGRKQLNLSLSERAIVRLSRKCLNLHTLNIADRFMCDEAMDGVSRACGRTLKKLSVRNCSRLGNSTLSALSRNMKSLRSIDISGLPLIDDRGLECILVALQNSLEELKVIGCTGLTDDALTEVLPQYGRRLHEVRLSYCQFSRSAVKSLGVSLPRITIYGSSSCSVQ